MLKGNNSKIRKILTFSFFILLAISLSAEDKPGHSETDDSGEHTEDSHNGKHDDEFATGKFIMDHIKDSHEWHLWTTSGGHHVSVPLPVILYSKYQGLNFFLSNKITHGHKFKGFYISNEEDYEGKIVEETEADEVYLPLDFSITKTVAGMIFASILMIILFIRMGRIYRREKLVIPSGLNGFIEPMFLFIRDQIAIPNIGEKKVHKYMPYLLTVFFFILINNLMGLIPPFIPFGANVTGNITVTMVLALFTFFITQLSGTRDYWRHIFATPGVPFWLIPIMIPVEVIGMFSKPFALMVRLFANITAGHIIILSLVSLIFIFKTLAVAPVTVPFILFMNTLEILVAFLQAYVFTLLSALFIGLAAKQHQH